MTMAPARAVTLIKPHHAGHPVEALPWWGVGLLAVYFVYRFLFPWIAAPLGIPLADAHAHGEPVTWSVFAWCVFGLVSVAAFFGGRALHPWVNLACSVSFAHSTAYLMG